MSNATFDAEPGASDTDAAVLNSLTVDDPQAEPAVEEPGEPELVVEMVTRDTRRHTLKVGFGEEKSLATIDGRWFTLSPDTMGRLNGEPIRSDEVKKEEGRK